MRFEDLILRPASGSVDASRVTEWLESQPHVFRDPVSGHGWHVCATARAMSRARRARLERSAERPSGVGVFVFPDRVGISVRSYDDDDLARAHQFVAWLVSDGGWTAQLDGYAPAALGDPRRLFPESLPDPASITDDPTLDPVTEGTLLTWTEGTPPVRELAIRTRGEWRYATQRRVLLGELSEASRAAFEDAVALVDADDPSSAEEPRRDERLEIETPEGVEWIPFDGSSPSPSCAPIATLLCAWLHGLDAWQTGDSVDGLERIHAKT